ncbi:hypothetical protein BD413DRAFT_642846 [Trametes elegans]|nr:hypothetical protein BD413DRAFT_642846 [Trametes elegans]
MPQFLGWGCLLVAAGTSYYYARKSINERRAMQEALGQRSTEKLDWRAKIEREEQGGRGEAGASPAAPSGASTALDGRSAESSRGPS